MTPRLLIIVVTTLRYRSRTPRLVVKDAATARHGSSMSRWLVSKRGVDAAMKEGRRELEQGSGSLMAAIEMRKFKSRRTGAAVAPDDGSLLVAAKGSRSGLGEHGRCLRMSPAGGLGVEASPGAPVLGFGAATGTARLPLFLGADDGVTDIAGVVVSGATVAFEGVAAGGVDVAG
ncbi:hypothetical protein B296_00000149 [Ensete ventricosum]|uniref:Uncharacterized protein n=1 Tax=Ensete ventricosum TaxID=4639 RepID=A0A427B711_ENSVE|nr:hypothetical protein B296_00000149 [Ensete ventricosum]